VVAEAAAATTAPVGGLRTRGVGLLDELHQLWRGAAVLLLDLLGVVGLHLIQRVPQTLVTAVEGLQQSHPLHGQLLRLSRGGVHAGVDRRLYPRYQLRPLHLYVVIASSPNSARRSANSASCSSVKYCLIVSSTVITFVIRSKKSVASS